MALDLVDVLLEESNDLLAGLHGLLATVLRGGVRDVAGGGLLGDDAGDLGGDVTGILVVRVGASGEDKLGVNGGGSDADRRGGVSGGALLVVDGRGQHRGGKGGEGETGELHCGWRVCRCRY